MKCFLVHFQIIYVRHFIFCCRVFLPELYNLDKTKAEVNNNRLVLVKNIFCLKTFFLNLYFFRLFIWYNVSLKSSMKRPSSYLTKLQKLILNYSFYANSIYELLLISPQHKWYIFDWTYLHLKTSVHPLYFYTLSDLI